jgi:hypothetical protein
MSVLVRTRITYFVRLPKPKTPVLSSISCTFRASISMFPYQRPAFLVYIAGHLQDGMDIANPAFYFLLPLILTLPFNLITIDMIFYM